MVNVDGSIGLEKVTSTEPTAVLRGLGETPVIVVIAGGLRSMKAVKSPATDTLPATVHGRDLEHV